MMSSHPTILLSMGTRPEIIKMAPVYLELKKRGVKPLLLHTGQHGDIAASLYELFGMAPDYRIDLKRNSTANNSAELQADDLAELGSKLLLGCSELLTEVHPSMVLVHGDTSSAVMMAMAAYYQKCKIAHIEAGLRSHDEYHPFPEEKNRAIIAQLAQWHFAPTQRARNNLMAEGVHDRAIHVVGNTVVQATKLGADRLEARRQKMPSATGDLIDKLSKKCIGKRMVLVTTHRRENLENGIREIASGVFQLLVNHEDMVIVWPVHPNPKVMSIIKDALSHIDGELAERLYLTKPLDYPVLLWVLQHSWVVLTDSGGIQEEAAALSTPVLVLRKATERTELIEVGAGTLVGADAERIVSAMRMLLENPNQYAAMKNAPNPFGDMTVAHTICNILLGADHA